VAKRGRPREDAEHLLVRLVLRALKFGSADHLHALRVAAVILGLSEREKVCEAIEFADETQNEREREKTYRPHRSGLGLMARTLKILKLLGHTRSADSVKKIRQRS
jgi:hypothetical protein